MLERVKHENTVDIYGHVTVLRTQRNFMVQNEVSSNANIFDIEILKLETFTTETRFGLISVSSLHNYLKLL